MPSALHASSNDFISLKECWFKSFSVNALSASSIGVELPLLYHSLAFDSISSKVTLIALTDFI